MNTQFSPYGDIVEYFEAYDDVQDWFMKVNLINKKEHLRKKEKEKYFQEIIDFRTLLRLEFKKFIESKISIDKILTTTNNILNKNKVHPKIVPNNNHFELQYIYDIKNTNYLLTIITIQVSKLLSSKEFQYLKKCDNHKCSLFFIDTSRNHSRRWCSMDICGNRSKVNNFAKRKKNLPS